MVQMFEELSGSFQYKAKYEDLKKQVSKCEEKIKGHSEMLNGLKMEKIKLKGL